MRVLVVVSRRYNHTEFWVTLKELTRQDVGFDIVSTALVIQDEDGAVANRLDHVLDDIQSMSGYDGIIIVSGNPKDTEKYWYDKHCQALIKEAVGKDLAIAGICAAVPAIRLAAKDKKVSYYPLLKSRYLLQEAGAILQTTSLSTDGRLVTAENEAVTSMWVTNFCDVLFGRPPTYVLQPSTFKRKLSQRQPIPEVELLKKIQASTGRKGLKNE